MCLSADRVAARRVHERAREKSIPKVKHGCTFEHSSDFMSNGTRECGQLVRTCVHTYVYAACTCVCARAFWIARLLAGLQKTLLYVLLLRHEDSIIIYFVCRTCSRELYEIPRHAFNFDFACRSLLRCRGIHGDFSVPRTTKALSNLRKGHVVTWPTIFRLYIAVR